MSTQEKHDTREAWLIAGIARLRPLFIEAGYTVPENVRVTCGFPSRMPLPKKGGFARGQCWSDTASEGKVFEIFISPLLAEAPLVLLVLTHELVHATVGLDAKHGKPFKRCANAVGLIGKMTTATASPELRVTLDEHAKALGEYPHAALIAQAKLTDGTKKQGTRLIKCECNVCGYTVRTTRKWIERDGAPLCPRACCDKYREPMGVE